MGKFTVLNHPLIQHKLTIICKEDTGTSEFRQIAGGTGGLAVYEATYDLPLENVEIETPTDKVTQKKLAGRKLVIVPASRAGLGIADGVLQVTPSAKVGHIDMCRDEETLKPHEYFFKMPQNIEERDVITVDPMPTTGDSANMATDTLRERDAKSIRLVVLVTTPEGVKNIQKTHPDVDICAAVEDGKLVGSGCIFPGLGDVGDHLFDTK